MRAALLMLAIITLSPVSAFSETRVIRNKPSSSDINGDLDGDLSGANNQSQQYYYKQNQAQRPGCYKNRQGNVICK
ncbi:hypothetical protein [Rhizobium sp. FKL33]|uniref:hypothetical protein n=1 Tax=Rhizobium sp. FKL33 TaxID=2562307 RepID=UPI0010BF90FD|nr:hypothetical protein [Rhizobium sp. FKL33]